jgi:hypothetical protein
LLTSEPYRDDRIEPSRATPTAPPICRVVSFMAEPTPAFSRGSDPMIDSVAGAMMCAIPRPRPAATVVTHSVLLPVSSVVMRSRSTATIAMPNATTFLLPNRCTHRVDSGANTIMHAACGISSAPAFTVE